MNCSLCGEALGDGRPSTSTMDGGAVHVACADREAENAYSRRRLEALGHLIVILLVGGVSIVSFRPAPSLLLIVVGLAVVVAYAALHWRYFRAAIGRARIRLIVGRGGSGTG